jgi:hypothetical protein
VQSQRRLNQPVRTPELCLWFVTRPSMIHLIVQVRGHAHLIVQSIDAEELPAGSR